jgi:hypothetical protein
LFVCFGLFFSFYLTLVDSLFRRRMLRIRCRLQLPEIARSFVGAGVFLALFFWLGESGRRCFAEKKLPSFVFPFFMGWGVWNSASFRLLVLQTWSQAEEEMVTERAR